VVMRYTWRVRLQTGLFSNIYCPRWRLQVQCRVHEEGFNQNSLCTGHSNCGKSSLVNALTGLPPRKGPASVHQRAGWTDTLQFYKLGRKPPVLTLVLQLHPVYIPNLWNAGGHARVRSCRSHRTHSPGMESHDAGLLDSTRGASEMPCVGRLL
jgi:energy-coupling factor transporter ATP-binding protein EcfA2